MRRIGLCATIALLAALCAAPVHALPRDPKAVAAVGQFAYASNIVRIKGVDYMILAGASRETRPDGTVKTTAYAQRSPCATLERKRVTVIACASFVWPHKVPAKAFDFDPLMDSARLRLPDGAARLTWKGRGVPDAYPGADPQYGAFASADLYRDAVADGKLVGVHYRHRHFGAFAILNEGASAAAYRSRNVSIEPASHGALKVRAVYRVRR